MIALTEAAVIAAAHAIFEQSAFAGWPPALKAQQWLQRAEEYRGVARLALLAALPHLHIRE